MVNHFLPTTKKEALAILSNHPVDIIAGGTDLMVQRRTWANTPPKFEHTMNIMHIKELKDLTIIDNEMHIGATVSLSTLYEHPNLPELLQLAIHDIASPALRNLATIAGNIGNASPAGDTLPILYALNAKAVLESDSMERTIFVKDLILGPRKTAIQNEELITKIILPLESFTKVSFVKVGGRKADAISKVSFTSAVTIEDEIITDIRICFGAVAPTIIRNETIEQTIIGQTVEHVKSNLEQLVDAYSTLIRPIDDQRSTKRYRTTVARNLLKDFIQQL